MSEQQTFVWCQGNRPSIYQTASRTSVQEYVSENDQWTIRSLDCPSNGAVIARALIQGTAIAICDGSYKDQFGTAGFVLQNGFSRESRILGANVTPGHPDEQNPYRSEIGGMAAIVVVVEALTLLYDIQTWTIELGFDC